MPTDALVTRASTPPSAALSALERWQFFLENELDCEVHVVFTRARKTPIRIRPLRAARARTTDGRRRGVEVRMHAFFDAAPPEVQRAVASWIRSGERAPRACRVLDDWIETGLERLPPAPVRTDALDARGTCYDLEGMLDELLAGELVNDTVLHERRPVVTWGRRAVSRSRGSLRLGSYDPDLDRVRLHPVLDQPGVPEWFVRYVVFHECLHAIHPPRRDETGRWIHHGPEFRAREKAYPDTARVLAWEKKHLRALVRSARTGAPIQVASEKSTTKCVEAPVERAPARPSEASRALQFLQTLLFGE